jgi:ribosomal protein L37AE/L43A
LKITKKGNTRKTRSDKGVLRKGLKCPSCGRAALEQQGWYWRCTKCKKYFQKGFDGKLSEFNYRRIGP